MRAGDADTQAYAFYLLHASSTAERLCAAEECNGVWFGRGSWVFRGRWLQFAEDNSSGLVYEYEGKGCVLVRRHHAFWRCRPKGYTAGRRNAGRFTLTQHEHDAIIGALHGTDDE